MTMHDTQGDLSIENLLKQYGNVRAVDDVSLHIRPGEFLTLLGPSGSGKTTLLMMIAGFVAADAGRIGLGGRDITHLAPEQRNFGMVFQGYALFPHLSVRENVAFPLKIRRRPKSEVEAAVKTALDRVQMAHLADRLPRQLSGGQQQRVALARAMSFQPNLLLLDEPLGALDRKLRVDVQMEIKKLHQDLGTTFIYVTHDQEEALSMSDRIVIFRQGRIAQIGTPSELYNRPQSRFVAAFLGESDFIAGTVQSIDGGIARIATPAGEILQNGTKHPSIGSNITVALRPEKIALLAEPTADRRNCLPGRIVAWRYLGGHLCFEIAVEGIGPIRAEIAAAEGQTFLQEGKQAWLAWQPQDGVTVTEE
ncbi:ABC transporter ATP-binding protein [Dongia soli]|uniref:ABC transporter ATP-binding protein n=1 Tax=Dongia soli TaxID=600628 RepID=A0ABU5EF81_9PROT|nr:ABC transporter ATP-binding protein [Dongia soli]MDY0884987.1 ABC transporter ATP-binding protein [Dongia soli]